MTLILDKVDNFSGQVIEFLDCPRETISKLAHDVLVKLNSTEEPLAGNSEIIYGEIRQELNELSAAWEKVVSPKGTPEEILAGVIYKRFDKDRHDHTIHDLEINFRKDENGAEGRDPRRILIRHIVGLPILKKSPEILKLYASLDNETAEAVDRDMILNKTGKLVGVPFSLITCEFELDTEQPDASVFRIKVKDLKNLTLQDATVGEFRSDSYVLISGEKMIMNNPKPSASQFDLFREFAAELQGFIHRGVSIAEKIPSAST